ncbi:MarR family transcriptional regulator [Quadrisphaera sp. DSM 44207]|uniref:MarR family transcriptional regulator n=1 Tax=Quadrisphaera sp. DSM 44207 TaxID=1881057 RepID=UPI0008873C06|nr:MarR family transcriptional regulator [Quadrisphaera sp. DSM 44207]SDQ65378.1 DNA-binding transcriptional regulator, MarR family [Quadrisphaera sp. DSM 44207]
MTSAPAPAPAPVTSAVPASRCRPAPLAAELRVAVLRAARRLRRERSSEEITDGQHSVLAALDRGGPATPRALADSERVQPPSMTRTLNALAEAGLVVRTDHPDDRRQVLVALTDAGARHVRETRRRRDAWLAARLAELAPADREVLARAVVLLQGLASR